MRARDERRPLSVGLVGNAAEVVQKLLDMDFPADIVTDQTSAHDPLSYVPVDLTPEATAEMALVVTFYNELGLPPTAGDFDVMVSGTTIAHFRPNATATGFYDARYVVPASLNTGAARLTVRFQASATGRIVPVFGVRMVRAAEAR